MSISMRLATCLTALVMSGNLIAAGAPTQDPVSVPTGLPPASGAVYDRNGNLMFQGWGVPTELSDPPAIYKNDTPNVRITEYEIPRPKKMGPDAPSNKLLYVPALDAPGGLPKANAVDESLKIVGPISPVFDAITFDNDATASGFFHIPPDSHAAAGPNHVVVVANTSLRIYDKTGALQGSAISLQSFFSPGGFPTPPTTGTFDPKIMYDSFAQRWVLVTLERVNSPQASYVFVAVSNTSDPTGSWTRTRITSLETINGNVSWLDYPGFGYDEQAVYITGNMFSFAGLFQATRLFIMPKGLGTGGFYDGGTATANRFNPYSGGGAATTSQAARIIGAPPAGNTGTWLTAYSSLSGGGNEFIQIVRIDNPVTVPTFTVAQLNLGNISNNGALPNAAQSGTANTILTNDSRSLDAVWHNNSLWTVFSYNSLTAPNSGQVTARYIQLNTTNVAAVTVAEQADVGGEDVVAGVPTFFPAISVNERGAMLVGFSASSASIFPGAYAASHRTTDAAGVMSSTLTLRAGTDHYLRTFGSGQNRWGDYSGVATDPSTQCFWVYNQYAMTRGTILSGEDGRWATTMGRACVCHGTESSGDTDLDGICTGSDNCSAVANFGQSNQDGDSLGDACDACPSNPAGGCTAPSADLSIVKTDGVAAIGAGTNTTYTITVTNPTANSLSGVTVIDNFPAQLAGCTWTCAASGAGSCARSFGSGNMNENNVIAANGTLTYSATCTVHSTTAGNYTNTATVSYANDPVAANNTSSDINFVGLVSDVSITKTDGVTTVNAGGSTTYTIVASNPAASAITGVAMADTLPGSLTCNWTCSAPGGSCQAASGSGSFAHVNGIAAGGTVTYTLNCTVAAGASGTITNTASATYAGDPNSANNSASDVDNVNTAPTLTPGAAISHQRGTAASVATIGTVADGQTAAGSLTVTQIAGGTATGITVGSITNTTGTITAPVSASCTATAGTVRFQVSDGSLTGTGDLSVTVPANTAPTLTYAATVNLNAGTGTTVNPATGLTDNGTATAALQSQGTYTGTINVSAAGVVNLSNAAPAGTHTITVRATDNCGTTTDASFNLVINSAPTFTPAAAISRQQGTAAGAAVTVGTVADATTPAGSLTVTQIAGGTATGITVGSITNTTGTITAPVSASCTATAGTVRFQVSDGSLTSTGDLSVTVPANTAPTLTYAATVNLNAGAGTTVNPATGPTDNGTVTTALQSQGTYTGTINVSAAGVVTLSNAAPAGTHTITVRATDNCGTTTDASFNLVINSAPTFTPAAAISRQQGTAAGAAVTVGTVADATTPAGSLTVTQIAGGTATGITVGSITNTTGTITAPVSASCTATAGTVRFQVSDGSLTGTGDLSVTVPANTAPTLTYAATVNLNAGAGTTVNPATGLADNGTATAALQSQGTYTGTINVSAAGVVTLSNAAPAGTHTITVRATDNCGTTTDASFNLVVNSAPTFTPAAAISRQQGTAAGAAVTVGTAADATTPAGSLTVTQIAGGTATGITVGSITNTTGTITAPVSASCTAVAGTVRFQVSDGSLTGTGDLSVTVPANTAPTLTYAATVNLNAGAGTTVNPATGLTDNGTATAALQSQGTYTGTINVSAAGVVTLSNAAPAGTHTITVRATDNCGATTDASFNLVINSAPTFTPAAAISRQQGTAAGAAVTVGTAADATTPAGSLTVTQIAGGTATGITVGSITNTTGTITAPVSASCTATAGTVRFQVSDGSLTGTGDLSVTVPANTAPTLTYAATVNLNAGAGTTVNPATGLTDNGTATAALQSQGTYTGTINVSAAGVVTLSNAAPAGTHTITVRATDNCGTTTDASFNLVINSAPTFTPAAAISRQQGTAAGAAVTVGTAADATTPAGSLTVTQIAGGTATGITVGSITNTTGTITAPVSASCTAVAGTVRFQVSDGSLTGTGDLSVTVPANTAPTLSYAATANVNAGAGTSINPASGPSDNGSVATIALLSQGTYTGTISVSNSTGVITLNNAAPIGTHTIMIRATDNCGTTTDRTILLTVDIVDTAPTFTPALALTRVQGTPAGAAVVIGTAADGQTPPQNLTVTQVAGGTSTGIVIGTITNVAGSISAPISASCTATSGTVRFQVSDGTLTGTGDLQVNVTTNPAPTLGSYANAGVVVGNDLTVTPSAAPGDNGSVDSFTASILPASFTGTLTPAVGSGNVVIDNAAPVGSYTVTVQASDNCGANTSTSFTLEVQLNGVFANGFE